MGFGFFLRMGAFSSRDDTIVGDNGAPPYRSSQTGIPSFRKLLSPTLELQHLQCSVFRVLRILSGAKFLSPRREYWGAVKELRLL